jgi:hypothetical protein
MLFTAHSASLVLSQQIHQNDIVQKHVCQQALQLTDLIIRRFMAMGIAGIHAPILGFEFAKRYWAETVLETDLRSWRCGLLLFNHPDDQRLNHAG